MSRPGHPNPPQAYYWLRHNTDPDAKIMSWWDYGYQVLSSSSVVLFSSCFLLKCACVALPFPLVHAGVP